MNSNNSNHHDVASGNVELDVANANPEEQFVDSVRQHLDSSCAALDGYTLSRLHKIRSAALVSRQRSLRQYFLPFGSLLTACLLVAALGGSWLQLGSSSSQTVATAVVEDIEILTANETIDFYENYEFYQWLASNDG